jgi:hypothetical protein
MPPPVGRQDVTAADIGAAAPITTLELPANGGLYKAEDLRNVWAAAAKNDAYVRGVNGLDNKVDRDGDAAMTGAFVVTDGSISVTALAPNNNAITGTGQGVGAGLVGIGGATGPGLTAGSITLPTTTAASIGVVCSGLLQMQGDAPNANVDPGEDNTISPQSINSSSISFATDGAGNVTVSNANGFNVNAVTIFGDNVTLIVAFKRNLPSAGYRPYFGEFGPYKAVITGRAANQYTFKVWDLATAGYLNVSTNAVTIAATTVGF